MYGDWGNWMRGFGGLGEEGVVESGVVGSGVGGEGGVEVFV